MKVPVVFKLLLPLIFGILTGYFTDFEIPFGVVIAFALALVALVLPPLNRLDFARWSAVAVISGAFFVLGLFLETQQDSRISASYFAHHANPDTLNYYHLRIEESPVKKEKWIRFEAGIQGVNGKSATGKAMIYIARDSMSELLRYGDQVYASAGFFEVQDPVNPHEFNYKNYLRLHDIHHQAFIKAGHWKTSGNSANPVLQFIYHTRNSCNEVLENAGMSPENTGVAKALILGDKAMIEDELMMSYAASGALHVLAVSGLHVGIIMLILTFVFSPVKRIRHGKIIFILIAVSGVWFYSLITGLCPSVLRAAVMFSFVILGTGLQRGHSIYQSLMVSAMIILLIDPHALFKVGFLLSYLAVFGIVFFHPLIFGLLHFKNFLLNKIWQITAVSIAAQIATFPIGIYCFQQFPNFFLLANLVVIPVSFVVLVAGLLYIMTAAIPLVNTVLLWILDLSITVLNGSVKWIESLPYSVFWGISIQWFDVLILYGFIFSITIALLRKARRMLWLSFGLLTLTVLLNTLEKYDHHSQDHVVFYAVKDELAVDVFYGEEVHSLMSESLISDEEKLRYHVYPNRYATCGSNEPDQLNSFGPQQHLLKIDQRKVLLLNQQLADSVYNTSFPMTDAVYLHDVSFLPGAIIDEIVHAKISVISGFGVSHKLRRFLARKLKPGFFYDLQKSGALSIAF